ncbi:MAG: hypothetical protein O3A53_08230 [Acidobacteria bacterium]|nr:hypothetical protein [Acidobacteriota bacterium]MDA1234774.1 hypothetical protein [Acidobacteriota bacterium]
MSVSSLLIIVAIAAPIIAFADTAMQWSLRLILDEGFDYPRAKAEVAAAAAAEREPIEQTAQAA